jgi:hypothetical protein
MIRRAPSVVLATLLLAAQLLLGATSAGVVSHEPSHSCDGCPSTHSNALSHDFGSSGSDCESHCSDDGSTQQGCGSGCAMAGSSHCGFSANPALPPSSTFHPAVAADAFAAERHAVDLPDSPLFDFLRPPTRG